MCVVLFLTLSLMTLTAWSSSAQSGFIKNRDMQAACSAKAR